MPSQPVTTQKAALLIVKAAFYIPKGIVLPILSTIDQTENLLAHDDIACAHCYKQLVQPESARSHIEEKTSFYLSQAQNWLVQKIQQALNFFIWILTKLFPQSFLNFFNNFLQESFNRWELPLTRFYTYLSTNRSQLIWYGFLPLCLLTGCAWAYGIGIIPEIYAFIAGSYWGGKIINHTANLIVQQGQSKEWAFIKNPITPTTKQEAQNLAKRLLMDIFLLSVIQKFYQFVGYCFQAFFAWLIFYVAVKKAGEESGVMMDNLGNEIKRENSHLPNYRSLRNALWLVSYHSFKLAASESAYKRYEALHEKRHLPQNSVPAIQATIIEDPKSAKASSSQGPLYMTRREYPLRSRSHSRAR